MTGIICGFLKKFLIRFILKVDFDYETKFHGYVKNLERQFWLLSDDHRGTPEK